MTELSQTKTETLSSDALRQVLVTDIGLDAGLLSGQPQPTLELMGMDSLAQVELSVVLHSRYGIVGLPENAQELSFDELAARICG